ncbi:MAG TPA: RNA polymerase sigma factor [Chloroflexia bacterium]|nr:RNA polymerase sigma factor [Chloroflexia bacterium]
MAIKKLDSYIVERARQGDHEAFSAIFEEYGRPVAGYLFRLLGDREAAGDLSQETFLKAYRGLMKLTAEEMGPDFNLSAWLFTIAHHNAMDYIRRNKRRGGPTTTLSWLDLGRFRSGTSGSVMVEERAPETASGEFAEPGGESVADQVEIGDTVGRVLGKLAKEHAECLILHYHQGFSYAEAAEILGLPLTTFKMRLYRARQAFQQAYQQEEVEDAAKERATHLDINAEVKK